MVLVLSRMVSACAQFALEGLFAAAGQPWRIDELEQGAPLGGPDRHVFGADDAVGASVGATPIVKRSRVAVGDDGVLEAGRPGRVVVVHGAVVEDAEADRDAGLPQQGTFDGGVTTSGLDGVLNVVEGVRHSLGGRPVSERFPGFVGLVEVLEASESGGLDGGFEMVGPGTVGAA